MPCYHPKVKTLGSPARNIIEKLPANLHERRGGKRDDIKSDGYGEGVPLLVSLAVFLHASTAIASSCLAAGGTLLPVPASRLDGTRGGVAARFSYRRPAPFSVAPLALLGCLLGLALLGCVDVLARAETDCVAAITADELVGDAALVDTIDIAGAAGRAEVRTVVLVDDDKLDGLLVVGGGGVELGLAHPFLDGLAVLEDGLAVEVLHDACH